MAKTRRVHCRVMLERLSAYLDGDLGAAACRAIEAHARRCPRCARTIDELRRTIGVCHRAAARPLPPAVHRRAVSRVRALLKSHN